MLFPKSLERAQHSPYNEKITSFINHIHNEDKPINQPKNFCKYLAVDINGISTSALLDGGNDYRSCISDKLAASLDLSDDDLEPVEEDEVGTASCDANMLVLGQTKRCLRMNVQGTTFKFRPVVVQGLSMDVNISGPWMHTQLVPTLWIEYCGNPGS